jgi:hypothetical protein
MKVNNLNNLKDDDGKEKKKKEVSVYFICIHVILTFI